MRRVPSVATIIFKDWICENEEEGNGREDYVRTSPRPTDSTACLPLRPAMRANMTVTSATSRVVQIR